MAVVTKQVDVREYNQGDDVLRHIAYEDGVHDALTWLSSQVDIDNDKTLRGLLVSTPRGDGYAVYVVIDASKNPVELAHVPTVDAWEADPIWLRGLTREDIVNITRRTRKLREVFNQ